MLPLWLWWCMDHDHGNFAFDLFNDQLDDGKSERIWLDHDLFSLPLLLLLAKSRWEKMIERGSKNGSSFANQTIISPWKAIGLGMKKIDKKSTHNCDRGKSKFKWFSLIDWKRSTLWNVIKSFEKRVPINKSIWRNDLGLPSLNIKKKTGFSTVSIWGICHHTKQKSWRFVQ